MIVKKAGNGTFPESDPVFVMSLENDSTKDRLVFSGVRNPNEFQDIVLVARQGRSTFCHWLQACAAGKAWWWPALGVEPQGCPAGKLQTPSVSCLA